VPPYHAPMIIVTTDDGMLFSCEPITVSGQPVAESLRWRLIDARGLTYIGPPYNRDAALSDVERLISAWWEKRKAASWDR
jgi:hypothetical protein